MRSLRPLQPFALASLLILVCILGAGFAACSDGAQVNTSTASTGGGTDAGTGSNSGGNGGGFGTGGPMSKLTISPPTATITITDKTTPATQPFVAALDGVPVSS